jgi:hypothetical protein
MARASRAGVTEVDLLEKCKANARIQPHVLGFIEATDKAGYVLDLYDKCVAGGSGALRRDLLLPNPNLWLRGAATPGTWSTTRTSRRGGTSATCCAPASRAAGRCCWRGPR